MLRFPLNKQLADLEMRMVQAAILAALLWAMRVVTGWDWLLFAVIVTLGYGVFCLGYAIFTWRIRK